jgi:nicotinamide-nucleotide amidase
MNAVIISCGTEIVTGQCVDTNSAWLSERLTAHGIEVVAHVSVGDNLARMVAAIRRARDEADLVLITGGLGPTLDDLAREALALALNRPLHESAEALAQIFAFFQRWRRDMPESNRVQALIPEGCEVIANPRGTAPGIVFFDDAKDVASTLNQGGLRGVIALPGVPGEMKAMFDAYVEPRLASSTTACTLSARLHCFGINEARLGETIADLMTRERNPLVGTTASKAVLTVRVLATATDAASARKLLDADRAEIHRRIGSAIFGEEDDTLQSAVAKLLIEHKKTVATAESCTGGMLSQRLTDVPGSSAYFLHGYVVYSNESKTQLLNVPPDVIGQHGAVSEEVARTLAESARAQAGSDFAISITGIAGPGGGSPDKPVGLVYIGLADERGIEVRRILFGDHITRDEIRDRACKTALNMLRLRL